MICESRTLIVKIEWSIDASFIYSAGLEKLIFQELSRFFLYKPRN